MEKQSVARRREPSWRVAATNGLMNLMEAPRYRVAGEPRWRITEAKEGKKKRPSVEREGCKSTASSLSSTTVDDILYASNSLGEHRKQRTEKQEGSTTEKWGRRIKGERGFPDYRGCDGGGALTERGIRKAEDGQPLGFSQLNKECVARRKTICAVPPIRVDRG